ncbi:DUF6221 family protein [Nonomuraea sp. KM90]|uniref:DUF6221 family protein n=1 Tax=Nonomuraea sp. KM90 TaxID=3457428 RepID=UPI003FCE4878
MASDDLTAFLRARLDEEEKIAREADGISGDTWMELYEDLVRSRPLDDARAVFGIFIGTFTSGRMLAEIAAKRRVLDEHAMEQSYGIGPEMTRVKYEVCTTCSNKHGVPCATVRLLALPYASHRAYRKEWRP